ncbi:MAG: porin [Cycloclasticus sp.]
MLLKTLLIAILLFANWTVFASPSNAYADAVLEALQEKGILSEKEVSAIKLKASAAERVAKKQQEERAAQAKPTLPVKLAKSYPNFKVWGRLQPRYTFVPSKDGLEGTNSFTLRRARFGVNGYMADRIGFRYQYEAANEAPGVANANNLLDAWVRFEHFDDTIGTLTVGQQFIPGYTRRPQVTASVERKFTEYLAPGAAGRARGITLSRGDYGLPESHSRGLFGNTLHYDIGFFNGPDLSLNNDNNSTLFSVGIGIRPTGVSPSDDEYQFKEGPFTYGFGGSYSVSDDSGTLDTRFQAAGVRLNNEWFGLFADVQGYRWRGWLSWADFESGAEGGLATNTKGKLTDSLSSTALTLGISRSYQSSAEKLGFAWALQYQYVDNEHPSRTMFFRPLTGRSADEVARGMNQGEVYQGMLTWQLAEKVRLINEFSYYSPDDGGFSYPAFISQLQIDF